MSLLRIGEIFGNDTSIALGAEQRRSKFCPFRGTACTKQGIASPLGICSLSDGSTATVSCPVRFLEGGRVFVDAARLAFGTNQVCIAVPEVRLLEVPGAKNKGTRRSGRSISCWYVWLISTLSISQHLKFRPCICLGTQFGQHSTGIFWTGIWMTDRGVAPIFDPLPRS